MQKIKIRAKSERTIKVRRDKRRAASQMTKDRDFYSSPVTAKEPTGNWKKWWRAGCGEAEGKPTCEPGHAYIIERYHRAAHAQSKVMGRRIQRRRNNRLALNEEE